MSEGGVRESYGDGVREEGLGFALEEDGSLALRKRCVMPCLGEPLLPLDRATPEKGRHTTTTTTTTTRNSDPR